PSGTKNPYSAGVQAQRHHPWRVMRRVARQLPLGVGVDGAEVQFAPEVEDEVGQMVLGEPVPWRRRQQVGLIRVVRAVRLAHTPKRSHLPASVDPRAAYRNRLLGFSGLRLRTPAGKTTPFRRRFGQPRKRESTIAKFWPPCKHLPLPVLDRFR